MPGALGYRVQLPGSAAVFLASPQRKVGAVLGFGPGTEDPALVLADAAVVDRRLAAAHQAVAVELPQLVAVAAPPLALGVTALVLEADGNPVLAEGPQPQVKAGWLASPSAVP
jgi:hypothetical protein